MMMMMMMIMMMIQSQQEGDLSLYDDEETRQFYENVPDLKAIIPGVRTTRIFHLCFSF